MYSVLVKLLWRCPECGGPRGKVIRTVSFDGSRRLAVDGWTNACGHTDKYAKVRDEARRRPTVATIRDAIEPKHVWEERE